MWLEKAEEESKKVRKKGSEMHKCIFNAIINTCASVDYDGVVGDHVHLCPGVHLAGSITKGK